MAWFLNGDWDALTTPPGADVNDLPTIMEQIARAINERKTAKAQPLTDWYYTDALSAAATFPTAAQFAGVRVDGACVRAFLLEAKEYAENGDGWYTDATFSTNYDEDLWTTAGAGLDAFDITKGATYAPNWLRIQRALNLMRWSLRTVDTTGGDSEVTQIFMLRFSDTGADQATSALAWADILDNPTAVAANEGGFRYVAKIIEPSTPPGTFTATSRVIEEDPLIYTPNNTGATVLGVRAVVRRDAYLAVIVGDPTAPAIGGTAQFSVNGVVVTGWDIETSPFSASATAFHLDTSATYEFSLGFSDGNDAEPSVATTGAPGSYIQMPSITWLVDVQPALTIA